MAQAVKCLIHIHIQYPLFIHLEHWKYLSVPEKLICHSMLLSQLALRWRLTLHSRKESGLPAPLISDVSSKPIHLANTGSAGEGPCTFASPVLASQINYAQHINCSAGTLCSNRNGSSSLMLPPFCCSPYVLKAPIFQLLPHATQIQW